MAGNILQQIGDTYRQAQTAARDVYGVSPQTSPFSGTQPMQARPMNVQSREFGETVNEGLNLVNQFSNDIGVQLPYAGATWQDTTANVLNGIQEAVADNVSPIAGDVLGTSFAVIPQMVANPSPVNLAVGAVLMGASFVRASLQTRQMTRQAEDAGRDISSAVDALLNSALPGGSTSRDAAIQQLYARYRIYETLPFLSGNANRRKSGFRSRVKVATYGDWPLRSGSGRSEATLGIDWLRKFGFGTTEDRLEAERRGCCYMDRTTWAKGINYVGGKQLTSTKRIMYENRQAMFIMRDLVEAIAGASGYSAEGQRELRLSSIWSLMAQVIMLGTTTVVQDGEYNKDGKTYVGNQTTQSAVAVNVPTFWAGTDRVFGVTPPEMTQSCEQVFGAGAGEFVDGRIGQYLSDYGLENFAGLQGMWTPRTPHAPPAPSAAGGGSLAPLLIAAGAGAYLLFNR